MQDIRIEVGRHSSESPEVTYCLQLIKFRNRKLDTGTIIKEWVLEEGKVLITAANVGKVEVHRE